MRLQRLGYMPKMQDRRINGIYTHGVQSLRARAHLGLHYNVIQEKKPNINKTLLEGHPGIHSSREDDKRNAGNRQFRAIVVLEAAYTIWKV